MSPSERDTLFQVDSIRDNFEFNERVVEVFDDMLDRSIPCYQQVIQATASLLERYLETGDTVYDLGCANGSSLLELCRHLNNVNLRFIGIDNSPAMLDKARLKTELYSRQDQVGFLLEDITDFDHPDAGAIILNYTLQFIRPLRREGVVRRLYEQLRPGGILILSEKIICQESRLNREFIDIYHQFKKSKGYSELEIARKREALENVLIPFTPEENKSLLNQCGFQVVESFFQWFNFTSFVAIKSPS